MKNKGYISLHRSIQEHWLWEDKPFSYGQAWIDLILLARHEDGKMPYKGEVMTVKRGDIYRSISSLAERWGWSRKKASRFLACLESDQMVSIKSTTHGTTITIEKYDDFQNSGTTKGATKEQPRSNRGTQTIMINNENKEKENKKEKVFFDDLELNAVFMSYIEYRKKNKIPTTDHALELARDKILKLGNDTPTRIAIINQTMEQGWRGIFPLKTDNKKTTNFNDFKNQRTYDYDSLEQLIKSN